SMRMGLDHKEFADQVIPDLARWEDWSAMPRLVKMFKDSPADDWIRQPVVSFLLVAADQPGDVGAQAQASIKELEALDKDTVERARSLQASSIMPRAGAPAPVPAVQAAATPAGPGQANAAPVAAAAGSNPPPSAPAQEATAQVAPAASPAESATN